MEGNFLYFEKRALVLGISAPVVIIDEILKVISRARVERDLALRKKFK